MDLRSLADATVERFDLPSLALATGDLSTGEHAVSFSNASADPVRFPIASITKTFTAFRVVQLAREGRIDLDRSLAAQLPGFALADPEASRSLTPRDALCHFSGLPPHTWAWVFGDVDRRTWMRTRLPFLASAGPHRDAHRYSNILYAVLGLLIEQVTGLPWEQDLRLNLTEPLDLQSVAPLDTDWTAHCPAPTARTQDGLTRIPPFCAQADHPIAPASELMASMPDLVRWGLRVLASPDAPDLFHPHNLVTRSRFHAALSPLTYGLGWRIDSVLGHRRIWHSGQCSGYASLLSLDPDRGTVFAAACNVQGSVEVLQALDLYLRAGIETDWAAVPCRTRGSSPGSGVAMGEVPTGRFFNPGYGGLDLRPGPEGMEAVFQTSPPGPVFRGDDGSLRFWLPDYLVGIPIQVMDSGNLLVGFESAVPDLLFTQESVSLTPGTG